MAAVSLADATKEVARRDRVLAKAITRLGPLEHSPRDPTAHSGRSPGRSSTNSWPARQHKRSTRVRATVGPTLTPQSLASDARLRRAGLSADKLASLRDLAAKVSDGTVALTRSSVRSDDELIERLTMVGGIGRWTAQMYLLFQLRLDVWPVGDLGVRQGYALI